MTYVIISRGADRFTTRFSRLPNLYSATAFSPQEMQTGSLAEHSVPSQSWKQKKRGDYLEEWPLSLSDHLEAAGPERQWGRPSQGKFSAHLRSN
jgi:hypothetical protein